MTELVKTENAAYTRYEELLIRRDVIRKEAFHYQVIYLREFGELLLKVFEAKIKCIEKKKIITYCQRKINRGEKLLQSDIDQYINAVMSDYHDELKVMLAKSKDAQNGRQISEVTYRKIKSVYYKIAKLIHPDMNPALKDDETVMDLWYRAVAAYDCNDLKELEEVMVLITKYLDSINYKHIELEIPDINEKIFALNEEIEQILNTDPYQYKYLLADAELVEEKKQDLKDELHDFEKYGKELDDVIAAFNIERVIS